MVWGTQNSVWNVHKSNILIILWFNNKYFALLGLVKIKNTIYIRLKIKNIYKYICINMYLYIYLCIPRYRKYLIFCDSIERGGSNNNHA